MPDSSSLAHPAASRGLLLAVDVVLFTPLEATLAVLLAPVAASGGMSGRGRPRERLRLPSDTMRARESLDDAAARIARSVLATTPSLLQQAGARGSAKRQQRQQVEPQITVTYFGLVPDTAAARDATVWASLADLPQMNTRHREAIELGVVAMRAQVDRQPIAFQLLPPAFTLSDLQSIYELLLGRRLHKASFRRSLHASALVEATDEWRSERRGRPARLFRYSPPRRRQQRRGIRFDLL